MNTRVLRNTAGWMAASTLRAAGQIGRAHESAMRSHSVVNIYFHNPSQRLFSRIIQWFSDYGYKFLSVDELLGLVRRGLPLPKGSAWISFDDAWRGNLTEVIPTVRNLNVPITIFVPTAEVRRGFFWFSQAQRYAGLLPEPYRSNVRQLWKVPELTRRRVINQLLQTIREPEREVMTADEIAEIAKLPQVTIGSHSVNHAILPNCDDALLREELFNSRRELEDWTGRTVRFFSYPNGDFDARAASALAETGYELAFTTENRTMKAADPRYYLPRFSVMDDGSFTENLCHAFGLWTPMVERARKLIHR